MTPKYKCSLINVSVMVGAMAVWMGLYVVLAG